ncbi:MAG: hypothetical protein HYU71_01620 [Bacteroidetes bacterium]|nr:hypothetical protein [Bacteroidota bacterium]
MKYLLSFLLILLLAACSNPAGYAVKGIGNTVKECCRSLSLKKNLLPTQIMPAPLAPFPSAIFEANNPIIPTW